MQSVPVWCIWLVGVLLLALLCLAGGTLWVAIHARASQHRRDQQLAFVRQELAEKNRALVEAEREISRLKQIPKAELLPMLQLAHELRSPLAAIQNSLDMLLQGYTTTNIELQNELLGLARERAAALLTRVNDFMRLGAVRHVEIERTMQPVQLLDIVRRLAPEMRVRARWRAIDIYFELPDSLSLVTATPEEMEQLFSNLITNAIKYTNPGGRVTVALREDEHGVVVSVSDTGIGIAPEDLERIFEGFYRAPMAREMDAQGSGLGLTIVKRVVELYGGKLHVESEPGKGSTFRVAFPRSQAAQNAFTIHAKGAEAPLAIEGHDAAPSSASIASKAHSRKEPPTSHLSSEGRVA